MKPRPVFDLGDRKLSCFLHSQRCRWEAGNGKVIIQNTILGWNSRRTIGKQDRKDFQLLPEAHVTFERLKGIHNEYQSHITTMVLRNKPFQNTLA